MSIKVVFENFVEIMSSSNVEFVVRTQARFLILKQDFNTLLPIRIFLLGEVGLERMSMNLEILV